MIAQTHTTTLTTANVETHFRPLQLIEENNHHYFDHKYGKDPYWDDSLYDQMNLQLCRDDYPRTVDEDDPVITDKSYPGP